MEHQKVAVDDSLVTIPPLRRKFRRPGIELNRTAVAVCAGKVRFASYADTTKATTGRNGGNRDSKGRSAYRCEFCGGWHLGRGKQEKRR